MKRILLSFSVFFIGMLSFAQTTYNATTYHQFNTSYGYIQLGPMGTGYAHIYTDRPNFMFNKVVATQTGEFGSFNTSDLSFKTGVRYDNVGTARLTILNSNGYTGIGTSSPSERLEVAGNAKFNGHIILPTDYVLKLGDPTGSTAGYFSIGVSGNCYNTYADYKGNVYFRAQNKGGGSTMGLQDDGTVVINVWEKYDHSKIELSDNAKLLVNGGILCERIKVLYDTPNSDFVFEDNYKLRSLNEVETFVKAHKHLPEIPSAEEFKKKGYTLGEMDDLLLRKIEELTLYVVEQNKTIEGLKAKVEELQKEK